MVDALRLSTLLLGARASRPLLQATKMVALLKKAGAEAHPTTAEAQIKRATIWSPLLGTHYSGLGTVLDLHTCR